MHDSPRQLRRLARQLRQQLTTATSRAGTRQSLTDPPARPRGRPQVRPGRLTGDVAHRQAGGSPHPVLGDLQGPGQCAGRPLTCRCAPVYTLNRNSTTFQRLGTSDDPAAMPASRCLGNSTF